MTQIVQIHCEKCNKLANVGEVLMEEASTVTMRVLECSHCAFESGQRKGYKLGYSEGYLAKERGERFR